jgi:hypothetical protein
MAMRDFVSTPGKRAGKATMPREGWNADATGRRESHWKE